MRSEQEIRAQVQLLESECERFELLQRDVGQTGEGSPSESDTESATLEAMINARRQALHTLSWVLGDEDAQTPI